MASKRPVRRTTAMLAASLSAALLAACSGGSTDRVEGPSIPSSSPSIATPSATTSPAGVTLTAGDSGWNVYQDLANGFELQVPSWMRDVTSAVAAQDPLVRAAVINPIVQSTSVQVLVAPLDPGMTLEGFASTTTARLAQIPGFIGVQDRTAASIGGQPAELIDWSASANGATLVEREYLVAKDGRGYVVSIDTTPKLRGPDFKTFALIVARFSFD